MKKRYLILVLLIIGVILYSKFSNSSLIRDITKIEKTGYYFLQEGIYSSKEIMDENTKNLNVKLINYDNSKYYVYLGITKSPTIAKKLKQLYEQDGLQIYIKEIYLDNEEFSSNVTQFDLLINAAKTKEEILTIEEVVLANYEEIIKKS